MKKIYAIVLFCSFYIGTKAQYVQGDVNVMPQPMMNHDSTMCHSTCNLMYAITISNSFVGDTVKIKDQYSGSLLSQDVNISGANPWYVYLPVPVYSIVNDDQLVGGNAQFYGPPVKVISGPDTVYNINNFYVFPVSNPCMYGWVSGRVYVDYNNNCSFDAGDMALAGIPVDWTDYMNSPSMSFMTATGYSDGGGVYNMDLPESWMVSYSVSIPSNYQFIFPASACSPTSMYTFTTFPQMNADFSLQCSSNVDVQCYAGTAGVVRPNVPFNMYPSVSNTGCDSASGQLRLVLDSRVTYNAGLSSVPAPTVSGDTLTWNYANLTSLTAGGYWNSFFSNINLTPNSSVTSGDVLCFRIFTNVPMADMNPSNNDYSFCLPVVNSYDPNFKEVSPAGVGAAGGIVYADDSVLTYTIHFQNTGTAPALNIGVIDTLDMDLLPNTLQILASSHNVTPQWLAPGIVKFNFYNINLADSTSNEAASHGSVTFRIKIDPSLATAYGTQIKNTGYIYFDSNPAVVTNTVVNTLEGPLAIEQVSAGNGNVSVYPNPFTDNTTFLIQSDKLNENYSFEMTDVIGKKIKSLSGISEKQFSVSRNGLKNGVYFYKIYTSEKVIGIGKLIIE